MKDLNNIHEFIKTETFREMAALYNFGNMNAVLKEQYIIRALVIFMIDRNDQSYNHYLRFAGKLKENHIKYLEKANTILSQKITAFGKALKED
jgi:hypothetical protein